MKSQEEQEFARVEKEYESVAELAKEDEAKLQYVIAFYVGYSCLLSACFI